MKGFDRPTNPNNKAQETSRRQASPSRTQISTPPHVPQEIRQKGSPKQRLLRRIHEAEENHSL